MSFNPFQPKPFRGDSVILGQHSFQTCSLRKPPNRGDSSLNPLLDLSQSINIRTKMPSIPFYFCSTKSSSFSSHTEINQIFFFFLLSTEDVELWQLLNLSGFSVSKPLSPPCDLLIPHNPLGTNGLSKSWSISRFLCSQFEQQPGQLDPASPLGAGADSALLKLWIKRNLFICFIKSSFYPGIDPICLWSWCKKCLKRSVFNPRWDTGNSIYLSVSGFYTKNVLGKSLFYFFFTPEDVPSRWNKGGKSSFISWASGGVSSPFCPICGEGREKRSWRRGWIPLKC